VKKPIISQRAVIRENVFAEMNAEITTPKFPGLILPGNHP